MGRQEAKVTKKVTMAQIAAKTGLSQPTVSLVLNGDTTARISEATRKKVLAAARELHYVKLSRPLACDRLRIALVLDGSIITNDHFIQALNEAAVRANELNMSLCILDSLQDSSGRDRVQQEINSGLYAGAIITTNVTSRLDYRYELNCPCIYLNCLPEQDLNVTAVLPDDFGPLNVLAGELLHRYHRPFVVAGDAWMSATTDRLRAVARAAKEQGLEISAQDVAYTSWSFKRAFEAVSQVLQRPAETRPDIIFCASDFLAVAAYQAIFRAGLRIPEDIAVCGYDNQILSSELVPALTTVELPYAEMGAQAVDLVLQQIKDRSPAPKQNIIKVSGEIVRRESA